MDILKVLVIIAFVVVTICTISIHPSVHQPMIIEDADFKLTRISDTLVSEKSTSAPIETTTQNSKIIQLEQPNSNTTQQIKPTGYKRSSTTNRCEYASSTKSNTNKIRSSSKH